MADEIESGQELNATQLDAQRARNLLDRALGLAERDDVAGAIVTCRQSLALAPQSPQGWSMLGLLHERDGDIHSAIEAYEKMLQLSPGSMLERESLQRLRQKRGAAPRPAPKFNFDEISNGAPQIPPEPTAQPAIPQQIKPGVFNTVSLWNSFYFRSLPVLVTTVACLGLILVAQRVAANRQAQNMQSVPAVSADVETAAEEPVQPDQPAITPNTLAPPDVQSTQPGQVESSEATSAPASSAAPAVIPKAPVENRQKSVAKPKPRPKPQSRPTPRASSPSEMPVLPAPRLTLPKRSAPAPAVPNRETTDDPAMIGGGPVDVGNSDDSKYIPINPPHFPNASRN
jgi:hypothetical protein